ncbi:hypothetical protein [Sinomonas sp. P10A9]|uniref:Uncharacterized protein n=1 Tax=Sinomonas puerhi TaxID=3238584 RepID=A0AB39L0T3_9MICC
MNRLPAHRHVSLAPIVASIFLAAGALLAAPASDAAPPTPVASTEYFDLPAGTGCAFHLQISGTDPKTHTQTFYEGTGHPVRTVTAGDGYTITYTNVDNGKSLTVASTGSVQTFVPHPDGTATLTLTGFNGLIMFPTDTPAGPSTTQYEGRVVAFIDAKGSGTLLSVSGKSSDICAALT